MPQIRGAEVPGHEPYFSYGDQLEGENDEVNEDLWGFGSLSFQKAPIYKASRNESTSRTYCTVSCFRAEDNAVDGIFRNEI